ncbi:MAG: hypothetical protein JO306_07585 [Gemmatimonadetes bacterium]|nr:hypothetical protein [Gemmatimonadota bacterium]
MANVNVVVTCTKGKTRKPSLELQLGDVSAATPEERASLWIARLEKARGEKTRAFDLYSGDHWSVVRSLPAAAARSGSDVQLWICSAGYGLIRADTQLHPYSATFSNPNPDQVHRFSGISRREAHRRWWATLTQWAGPQRGAPRTIREIAERQPETPIVVVGSESYVDPIAADLRSTAGVLHSPDQLVILSAGTGRMAGLESNLASYDARLNRLLSGALMSLNVRVARELLEWGVEISTGEVNEWLADFGREVPRFEYPVRDRLSDDQVKAFIRGELTADPNVRWTSLHKKLRRELHLACEQKRFRDLFFTVRAEPDAQETPPS